MIQRKQSLFLLSLVLLSVALFIIPSAKAEFGEHSTDVKLLPVQSEAISGSLAHMGAIALNILCLLLSFVCIFMYKKRSLQLKLSYALMLIWLGLTMILSFAQLVEAKEGMIAHNTNYGSLLAIFGMLGAYLAAHYIKKDIELLKSVDRIR